MNDELLDLLDNYCSNGKLVDNHFVNQVFVIINKYRSLGKYLEAVYVTNKKSEYLAIDKTINISLIDVMKALRSIAKILDNEDYVYLFNVVVLETIFHELEHVYQEELKFSDDESIERTLIVLSDPIIMLNGLISNPNLINGIKMRIRLKRYKRFYDHHHNLAPHERLANLKAYQGTISLLEEYNCENDGIKLFYDMTSELINRQLINGYKLVGDITNSPSLDFLSKMKNTPNKYIIDNSPCLHDLEVLPETRLLCGLKLSKDEYLDLSKRIEEERNEYCR